jgi:hypothetical protein
MRLEVRAKVPGVDQAGFTRAAEAAKRAVRFPELFRETCSSRWMRDWSNPALIAVQD